MYKTKNAEINDSRILVTTTELCEMLGCGRKSALEIGKSAGARVEMGRLVRWNISKINRYLETVSE